MELVDYFFMPFLKDEGGIPSMRLKTTAMRSGSLKPESSEMMEMGWLVFVRSCLARVTLSLQSISHGVQWRWWRNFCSRLRRAMRRSLQRISMVIGSWMFCEK